VKNAHITELKNSKMLARKFTVDFFKEKSLKLCEDLTVEANLSYGRFDDARAMFF